MFALLPFGFRARLNTWRLVRSALDCPCDACAAFHARHHLTCCDCRACRRYARQTGACWLCDQNAHHRAG